MIATEGMWEIVSELLDGELLPDSMNETLEGLCSGRLVVVAARDKFAMVDERTVERDK